VCVKFSALPLAFFILHKYYTTEQGRKDRETKTQTAQKVAMDTPEADKPIIHRRTFEVLRPEILKLMELKEFADNAINIIRQNLSTLIQPIKAKMVMSDSIMDHLVRAINCLVLLDALKDMKACLLNDFSRYKRCDC